MTKKFYLGWQDIEEQCNRLSRKILMSKWEPNYIVGIVRGGLIPATIMSHLLKKPLFTLKVSLRDDVESSESNCWMAEDAFGYSSSPKNILIVDDINDTGATIEWIKKDWAVGCRPRDPTWKNIWNNNVRFACLVDNLSSSNKIDYCVKEINKAEENTWVVFPWEQNETVAIG